MARITGCAVGALVFSFVLPATVARGQAASGTPARPGGGLDVADRREVAPPPVRGIESKRWESWSAMRMAADPLLGWKIGMRSIDFPGASLEQAIEKTDGLSLGNIELFSTQKFGVELPKKLNTALYPNEVRAVTDKLIAVNMSVPVYHVPELAGDESEARKMFQLATALGAGTVAVDRMPADLAAVEKLATEFKIKVALCGAPKEVIGLLQSKGNLLGLCGDTGDWLDAGLKPLDVVEQAGNRLFVLNIRDRSALGRNGKDVEPGKGAADIAGMLKVMLHAQIKPSLITVGGPVGDMSASIGAFEEALRPAMAERVDGISRTTAIRGPERLTTEDKQKIDAALPTSAPVKPKKPRKLLVLDLNVAYGGHRSIPAENYAIAEMGKRTRAYEAVFDDNLDNLKYPKIKEYDAIVLNNTVGMIFVDPEVRAGLIRFVREGGGLAGNHGTSHASMDWGEFGDMIGVRRGVHRANTEKCWIKVDDPKSPLTAPFNGKEILYEDEYFRFPNPPYSRSKLHVLLSIDVAKTDMNQGVVHVPGSSVSRPDADYAVSWIRNYGSGRVFFCILGHNPTLFQSPELAEFYLGGLQFILGDLDADTTPSAQLAAQK